MFPFSEEQERRITQTQRLVCYALTNYADKVISVARRGEFDRSILDDVGEFKNKLPLYKLAKLHLIFLENLNLPPSYYKDIIDNCTEEAYRLIDFWETEFGFPADEDIDFSLYEDECGHFDESHLEVPFGGTTDDLLAQGYNYDEVLLCQATMTYNTKVLREQIEKGTNPNVWITAQYNFSEAQQNKDGYNALEICTDLIDICTEQHYPNFWTCRGKHAFRIHIDALYDLMEGAAYAHLRTIFRKMIAGEEYKLLF